eukprot:12416103-Karenia_brevis.AAC.1
MAKSRQRSLFPLPFVDAKRFTSGLPASQQSKGQRNKDIAASLGWANQGILALNELSGHGSPAPPGVQHSGASVEAVHRIAQKYCDL